MRNLLERALWTGVQSGLALLTIDALTPLNHNALEALSIAGVAAALSALKTLASDRLEDLKAE